MLRILGSILEGVALTIILMLATLTIVALMLCTWLIRLVVGISDKPFVGPYRQVR